MKNILFLFLLPLAVSAQWINNSAINTNVCNANGNQEEVRIISDGSGGSIITWMDSRPAGNTDIFAQRLNSSGVPLWSANGIPICTETSNQAVPAIVEDGNGGAIIVWKDMRSGNSDIFAQLINNNGAVQWTVNGIAVDSKTGDQIDPKIVSDGSNGAIITWQDSVNGNWDIYAQRIDALGMKLWSAGGVVICSAANDQKNPKLISNASGVSMLAWQDKRSGNDYDIYAQKLNSNGAVQWAVNGVSVCSAFDTQNNPKIENDGSDGAIIGWADKRNGSDYNIFAQRLNSSGISQWAANGVAITVETGNQSAIDIATSNISGAIFTWKDYRNNIYADIYAQYIDLSGTVQWAQNGIPVSTKLFDQLNPNIITESTGAIIVWQDFSNGQWDVYGQKILLNGTPQWGTNGKILGNALKNQLEPKHITDGQGGAIVVWQDFRDSATSKLDIYAQKINSDGSLDVGTRELKESELNLQVSPNPNSGKFRIATDFRGNCTLEVYNLTGEKIYSILSGKNADRLIDLSSQPKGIYFYKLSLDNEIRKVGKIVIQ